MNAFLRAVGSLIVFITVLAGPFYSWRLASQYPDLGTLSWCVVTKSPVMRGAQFRDEDVGLSVRRLKKTDTCVADLRRAVGKYAASPLRMDELVTPVHVTDAVPATPPSKGVAVPVEVKTEHAGSVRPGIRLAFIQEKDKSIRMIPRPKGTGAKRTWPGLEVISVAASGKASTTTVTVAVTQADAPLIPALGSGQWRPVIVSLQ